MSDLWLPPGARRYAPAVEEVIADSDDPAAARAHAELLAEAGVDLATDASIGQVTGPDSVMILMPRAWDRVETDDGRSVMCAYVGKCEPLRRMLEDGRIEVELFSVVDTAENPMLKSLCPGLMLRLPQFQTFTPLLTQLLEPNAPQPEADLHACPFDWLAEVQQTGFAIAVDRERADDDRALYVASPPLARAGGGFVLPPRARKLGRNDACSCGSGIKFKRCCGR